MLSNKVNRDSYLWGNFKDSLLNDPHTEEELEENIGNFGNSSG
jgi:hypothetical protein